MMQFDIPLLPISTDLETKPVMRQLAVAHRWLAQLNGRCATIPNENILINTLALQEAKESSAIENIITTHDALYKAQLAERIFNDAAAKEVSRYAEALKQSFQVVRKSKIITHNYILNAQKILEQNDAGYRKNAGTVLKNDKTGEIIYIPPQDNPTIERLMDNLVNFMNDENVDDVDPLIKMAIIHHRFETIHPFYDGNGRTGRIVNILYLVKEGLLDLPILYLSRYIIQYKGDYYKLLQQVRIDSNWEPWLLFILKGVEDTAKQALHLIEAIKALMQEYKNRIRSELPKIYSQDLLNNLFKHPYTKIDFLEKDLNISRQTASVYLNKLCQAGLLTKFKVGNYNFYMNDPLYNLFLDGVLSKQSVDPVTTITN